MNFEVGDILFNDGIKGCYFILEHIFDTMKGPFYKLKAVYLDGIDNGSLVKDFTSSELELDGFYKDQIRAAVTLLQE